MSTVSDYPDWLRVDQWVGTAFLAGRIDGIVNGQVLGSFFVAAWEAVEIAAKIDASSAAADLTLLVQFTDPAWPGVVVSQVALGANATFSIADAIAVQAPIMTITAVMSATPLNLNVTVIPRRGYNPLCRPWTNDTLLRFTGAAVGAGATSDQTLTPAMAAHCTFTVVTDATVWSCELQMINGAGANLGVVGSAGSAVWRAPTPQQVDLPQGTVRCRFINGDAVGRTWGCVVVPLRT